MRKTIYFCRTNASGFNSTIHLTILFVGKQSGKRCARVCTPCMYVRMFVHTWLDGWVFLNKHGKAFRLTSNFCCTPCINNPKSASEIVADSEMHNGATAYLEIQRSGIRSKIKSVSVLQSVGLQKLQNFNTN